MKQNERNKRIDELIKQAETIEPLIKGWDKLGTSALWALYPDGVPLGRVKHIDLDRLVIVQDDLDF